MATELGYITAGLSVDAQDWQRTMTADDIVRNVLSGRERGREHDAGNVVLLHDGGGDRARTVAVLGRLIDSLRARGDTIVSLGPLAGLAPDEVMPPITGRGSFTRLVELVIFGGVSILKVGFADLFYIAIVLAMGRLMIVLALASIQRFRRRRTVADYAPPVSVVIPAYREEAVIVATVKSLLAQDYRGNIEMLVVDDGSPDDTYVVAQRAFGDDPRVRILTKTERRQGERPQLRNSAGAAARSSSRSTPTRCSTPTRWSHLVAPLADPHVGAVAGNAKVGNRINLVTRWQALEYITSQNLDRRAFALLDCIMVVPGRDRGVAQVAGDRGGRLLERHAGRGPGPDAVDRARAATGSPTPIAPSHGPRRRTRCAASPSSGSAGRSARCSARGSIATCCSGRAPARSVSSRCPTSGFSRSCSR